MQSAKCKLQSLLLFRIVKYHCKSELRIRFSKIKKNALEYQKKKENTVGPR